MMNAHQAVPAMAARELISGLVDELPAPAPAEPFAFLGDERVPATFTLVEPAAFALACVQAMWGPRGPRS